MICSSCQLDKSDFKSNKAHKCISCQKEKEKLRKQKYYENNKDYLNSINKIYWHENKEHLNKCQSEYYQENKIKLRPYRREYAKESRANDPLLKLRASVSNSIKYYIKKNGSVKEGSALSHLPYTIAELRSHLESLFEPWMTWNNYGPYKKAGERTWQIDHIVPQSSLPYDSMNCCNFGKCWSLENLRPLDSLENIRKGNKNVEMDTE